MPSLDDPAIALLAEDVLAFAGNALSVFAGFTFFKYMSHYYTFTKLEEAKTVPICGLSSILSTEGSEEKNKLLVLRGFIQASLGHNDNAPGSGQKIVVICEHHGLITGHSEQELMEPYTLRNIILPEKALLGRLPFVLTGTSEGVESDCVSVSLDVPYHSPHLTRAFHQLKEIQAALNDDMSFASLDDYLRPIGVVDEKILAIGKEITAVGFCSLQDGNPQISPCKVFPYFLSDMTRDEMLIELDDKCRTWFMCTIVLGSLSLGIFGYLLTRTWRLLKKGRQWRKGNVAIVDDGVEKTSSVS